MRNRIKTAVETAFKQIAGEQAQQKLPFDRHQVSVPKQESHGDYASNIALVMASIIKVSPRDLASKLADRLAEQPHFEKIEVAGPGFLNFFIAKNWWQENLYDMKRAGAAYGESDTGQGKRVLVEFVSANPTGPLHVGHGRGAAVGDSLARVLKAAGYRPETEYYINDVGNQMKTLGRSVYLRYIEFFGRKIDFPKECYQGDYIKNIATGIASREGKRYIDKLPEECIPYFTKVAVEEISAGIRRDLEDFGVRFDRWFSERTLHETGLVEKTIAELQRKGLIYEKDEALWFRSTDFGDEKDRVVKRSSGVLTYFAADIAYHRNKLERNFDLLVDIWGADHHGYVPRVKAAIEALGYSAEKLEVLLIQLVNLLEGGKIKAMSTRAGEFVTLREVLDDVGRDAARFIFLTRKCDSPLDFDLDLARTQTQENPVYYVQYAHARLASVFRKAREQGIAIASPEKVNVALLNKAEEIRLLKTLEAFPRIVSDSAKTLEPHRISYYLTELAAQLHSYYTRHRFISEDEALTQARLLLADVTKQVFNKGLGLLGVSAPERM